MKREVVIALDYSGSQQLSSHMLEYILCNERYMEGVKLTSCEFIFYHPNFISNLFM